MLTHFDASGQAHMVDIADKIVSQREARAKGLIKMHPETLELCKAGAEKGDVLGVARLAGIMAAKRASDLIPLCHPLALSKVSIDFELLPEFPGISAEAYVKCSGQTGVEMEALTATSTALLTIYDMLKAVDRGMEISALRVTLKDGGKSGRYEAP